MKLRCGIAMHCNLRPPDVVRVLCFDYEAHNAPAYTLNTSQPLLIG